MELTSKQRAQLRSLATNMDTIVHVGKDGIGDNLVKQVNDALEARELIKGRVLENSLLTAREAAEELSVAARCEVVQVIGSKFVLYRMQHDKTRRKIELVKAKKAYEHRHLRRDLRPAPQGTHRGGQSRYVRPASGQAAADPGCRAAP